VLYLGWEMTWSFSLWLEAFAIMPQIDIVNKQKSVESFTAHYIAALGFYRFFYILNWIYRYYDENFLCWTSIITGIVQVLLYADFLYLYLKK
jgi:ER lumen protein retaining receptor